ncbi:MAG TPA: hypothetical protein VFH98_01460 [Candidatus Limnocylindria bacterium]|nr:hypothetical protein [Candidatus Limnocylindria bacterium]
MLNQSADPRTEDTIVFTLLRGPREGAGEPAAVGTATFSDGRTTVDAPEAVAVAVEELLQRPFVDRVQADERPRGYRRSGHGMVDMLVPGMPEHFIARMRGLWLAYPDGTVVTALEASAQHPSGRTPVLERVETGPAVVDPSVRRATLAESTAILNTRPLVQANEPLTGLRPPSERRDLTRTDCGWIC